MQPIIIIPAYCPDTELLLVLEQFREHCDYRIVVINDGSGLEYDPVFVEVGKFTNVKLIQHQENQGKGAALRTGFKYVLKQEPSCCSVVTADADGQHRADDILKICTTSIANPSLLILGARHFNGYVPMRSRLGNSITRRLYNLLFRQNLTDTQTGLRAIPVESLTPLLDLKGERYCYELEMLLSLNKRNVEVFEVPISTVYEKNNTSSHFRPIADSLQIYMTLLRWWIKKH